MSTNHGISPFHPGEQAVQTRAGVRDRTEQLGRRVIRDHLTAQHREFFAGLPYVFIGGLDAIRRPWASLVFGRPGFIDSPDDRSLSLRAHLLDGDPLTGALVGGAPLALLGIDYASRRRNRVSTRIRRVGPDGLALGVVQSFGNCPQYIQMRSSTLLPSIDAPPLPRSRSELAELDDPAQALIVAADHFAIATHHAGDEQRASGGADVSHRGGKPGFVRVIDPLTLEFPDYPGNNHFNTLGNLVSNPTAGITFIDFENGDLLYLSGVAEILWERAPASGAERRVRFTCHAVVRMERAVPVRFAFIDYAPRLPALDPPL